MMISLGTLKRASPCLQCSVSSSAEILIPSLTPQKHRVLPASVGPVWQLLQQLALPDADKAPLQPQVMKYFLRPK